jgi:hypothetical protein
VGEYQLNKRLHRSECAPALQATLALPESGGFFFAGTNLNQINFIPIDSLPVKSRQGVAALKVTFFCRHKPCHSIPFATSPPYAAKNN